MSEKGVRKEGGGGGRRVMKDPRTVDMFLTRGLERILRNTNQQKHAKLRDECELALDYLKRLHEQSKKEQGPLNQTDLVQLANVAVCSLRLACETCIPSVMCTALDCLQKMMAYGFIRGELPDMSEDRKRKKLIETVIETISACFDFPDDAVQLQIIKALLTAVTTPSCGVHADVLMMAVRTCYNIYLMSRNLVNQTTSKATLTQMLDIIFSRMESACGGGVGGGEGEEVEGGNAGINLVAERLVGEVFESLGLFQGKEKEKEEEMVAKEKGEGSEEQNGPVSGLVIERKEGASNKKGKHSFRLPTTASSPSALSSAQNGVAGSSPLSTASFPPRSVSPPPSLEIAPELMVLPVPDIHLNDDPEVVFHDCFLIFRALCKLSTKEATDKRRTFFNGEGGRTANQPNQSDSLDMRSKVLALELLLVILQSSGPVMRSHERFINKAIKRYLCMGVLSMNGVSTVPHIFKLSLQIFSTLIAYFKDNLKHEIGVFFEKIFLRIIESTNSTTPQKWMVLEALLDICKNPQTLVDFFLNYDCDCVDPRDVYERMVNDLSGIAKGRGFSLSDWQTTEEEEVAIRRLGLECLVTIMKSLVDWSKELHETYNNTPEIEEKNTNGKESEKQFGEGEEKKGTGVSGGASFELPSDGSNDLVRFERQMMYNQQVKKGKQRFNMKPKDGIKYLIGIGHLKDTPESIAHFLFTSDGLEKEQVGEYLGGRHELNKKVLYEYVDNHFNFSGMEFDLAIRKYLGTFMLPGEAEPIDRIVEKFAEKYYLDNNTTSTNFGNADAAYILAYATIMLATDLHNPSVAKKMTFEQWQKNLKGLNDEKDFNPEFLFAIFERIEATPFSLDFHGKSEPTVDDAVLTPKQRQVLFHQETAFMVKKSKEILREKFRSKNTFFKSTNIRHVRPMFSVSWCPFLAAFSYMLESTDDAETAKLCLEGFRCAMRVSSIFYMETEQNAFSKSLLNFTLLDNHIRRTKKKNIDAIKTLLGLAHTDGNYLGDSWMQVLTCVSHLEKLFLVGTGIPQPLAHVAPPKEVLQRRQIEEEKHEVDRHKKENYEEQNAGIIVSEIDPLSIERIFSQTKQLNGQAIVDFVRCLCKVSLEKEIKSDPPRTYSLQKLVEVAYENMSRIRLVWSRIWAHIGDHFTQVGCSSDRKLAMYAVDSLRQLSMKFLEKDELSHYNFQKSFLKPFGHILETHQTTQIRELVVHCLSQMVRSRAKNIQSGWKSIMSAFTIAACDDSEAIATLSFETTEIVVNKYFPLISDAFFSDVVQCLASHIQGSVSRDISLRAIRLVEICADNLGKGEVGGSGVGEVGSPSLGSCSSSSSSSGSGVGGSGGLRLSSSEPSILFTDGNEVHVKYWFAVFLSLSQGASSSSVTVRNTSSKMIFTILKNHGNTFSDGMWALIFRGILRPLFDSNCHLKEGGTGGSSSSQSLMSGSDQWVTSTCRVVMTSAVSIFTQFFHRLSFLLGDYLCLFLSCILQDNEKLADIGVDCVFSLINDNKAKWTSGMWDQIIAALGHILESNSAVDQNFVSKDGVQPPVRSKDIDTKGILEPRPPLTPPTPTRQKSKRNRSLSSDINGFLESNGLRNNGLSKSLNEMPEVYPFLTIVRKKRVIEDVDKSMSILVGRTKVQLKILQAASDLIDTHYSSFNALHITHLMDSLERMTHSVHCLNTQEGVWEEFGKYSAVWKGLIQEETEGLTLLINLMFRLFGESPDSPKYTHAKLVKKRLFSICMKEMVEYVDIFPLGDEKEGKAEQKNSDAQKEEYLTAKTKTTSLILSSIFSIKDAQFHEHMRTLYPVLCDLLLTTSHQIRVELRKLFLRIGSNVDFQPPCP